jgi:hypothetical protein
MKDRSLAALAKELNYAMSQPKHEAPKTENAGPGEQKFTVVVYDAEGKTVLFRQITGYSAVGVLTQYTEQVSSGNPDYGTEETNGALTPFFDLAGIKAHKAATEG